MKLKAVALRLKNTGVRYIAVDADSTIWAYMSKPEKYDLKYWDSENNLTFASYIGKYSGKKKWNKTLRKVK